MHGCKNKTTDREKAMLGNIKDNKKSLTEDKIAAYYQW